MDMKRLLRETERAAGLELITMHDQLIKNQSEERVAEKLLGESKAAIKVLEVLYN